MTTTTSDDAAEALPGRATGRSARPKLDAAGAAAVDLARLAAQEAAEAEVGDHLGATAEGDRVVTHRFASTHRGYRGWVWAVTVARVPRARAVTVSEVVLLPGEGALLPPPWVPWAERLEPGDLGATDLLPYRSEDPLLDEGFESLAQDWAEPDADQLADTDALLRWELGLGRARVLNRAGRAEAAARWNRGPEGPDTPGARAAEGDCASCGYLVGLRGSLRQLFGVCANAWSPEDGKVVSLDHGCGAHSETGREPEAGAPALDPALDELRAEFDTTALAPDDTAGEPAADLAAEPAAEVAAEPVVWEDPPAPAEAATGGAAGEDQATQPASAADSAAVAAEPIEEFAGVELPAGDTEPLEEPVGEAVEPLGESAGDAESLGEPVGDAAPVEPVAAKASESTLPIGEAPAAVPPAVP